MLQALQSIPDVTLYRGIWECCCLQIKRLLQTNSIYFPFDNQKLFYQSCQPFLFAVNRINMKYGEEVNSLKVRNRCPHAMCCVYCRLLWNNLILDNPTILSMVFIWEKNSGKTDNAIHLTCSKNLVLNLDCLTNSQMSYLPGYRYSLLLTCTQLKVTDSVSQQSSFYKKASLHYKTFGPISVKQYCWHTVLTIL